MCPGPGTISERPVVRSALPTFVQPVQDSLTLNLTFTLTITLCVMLQVQALPVDAQWHGLISQLLANLYGPVSQTVVKKVASHYEKLYDPELSGGMHPVCHHVVN